MRDDDRGHNPMVTAPPAVDGVTHDPGASRARRRVERLRGLPSSRAVVGGVLVGLAGVGTLVAWQRAAGTPEQAYVVADRAILPGETLSPDDVRLQPIDLPGSVAGAAFTDAATVADRVAIGVIGEGELVQVSQLSEAGVAAATAEVSLALERDRAVDGRLRSGDLVDVFVTHDDRTEAVVERVRVVEVADAGGSSFTSASQVTVTLALTDAARRAPVIHAGRAGEVTLVRSTHLPADAGPAPGAGGEPSGGDPLGGAGVPGEDGGSLGAGADAGSAGPADGGQTGGAVGGDDQVGSDTTEGGAAGAGAADGGGGAADGGGGADDPAGDGAASEGAAARPGRAAGGAGEA